MKYNLQKTTGECPLCGNGEGILLYGVESWEVARTLFSKEKEGEKFREIKEHIEKLWSGKKCKKILCDKCSLIYAFPFIGGDIKFYDIVYEKPKYPDWKWDYEVSFHAIKNLRKNERRSLLDIGSGKGAFVKKISPFFIPKNKVLCLEYSSSGRKELKKGGFNSSKESFTRLDTPNKYDVICLFQVLEHMDNLKKVFQKLREVTSPRGNIFITTPSVEKMLFDEQNGSALDLPPNHINWMNKKCFNLLCGMYNLELIDFKLEPYPFFRFILDTGLGKFGRKKLQKGGIEDKIDNIKNKNVRKTLIILFLILNLPFSVSRVLRKNVPRSQWIHLRKI